jgi:hypothetical protein
MTPSGREGNAARLDGGPELAILLGAGIATHEPPDAYACRRIEHRQRRHSRDWTALTVRATANIAWPWGSSRRPTQPGGPEQAARGTHDYTGPGSVSTVQPMQAAR